MAEMVAMSTNGKKKKNLKNLLPRNQLAEFDEILYVHHQYVFKYDILCKYLQLNKIKIGSGKIRIVTSMIVRKQRSRSVPLVSLHR